MRQYIFKITLLFLLISALVLPKFLILAQTPAEERQALEEELKQLEAQIAQYDEDITKTAQEKKTLQNQISILKNQINKLNLQISQGNIMIKDLGLQIKDTENSIGQTSLKIDDSKDKLAVVLRQIHEGDQRSLVEILFSETKISDFFDDLIALESLASKSQELLNEIKDLKSSLENQKISLDDEKSDLEQAVKTQTLQKKQNESNRAQQEYFLQLTETQYQKSLKEKETAQKKAAEIRARIFELIGVPQVTFASALETAKAVTAVVDIRPAFLLAVISQESAIGRNVGQCYLTNTKTGEGIRISNNQKEIRTMNPQRDVPYFLDITQRLGRNSLSADTPVSCWVKAYYRGAPFGWGGAMGPAQFIPSTWNLYAGKVQNINGRFANPWDIRDSFTAAALYLYDLGASAKTAAKEKKAAGKYYGDASSYYSGQVMVRADCIQSFIDSGSMSSACEDLIVPQ